MDDLTKAFEAAKSGQYEQAYSIWLPLAEQGNAYAQVNIGYLYHKGLFVEPNQVEAERWFSRAASANIQDIKEMIRIVEKEQELETYFELHKGSG